MLDVCSVNPIDYESVINSVIKTKRLLIADHADPVCSVASEIISCVSEIMGKDLLANPQKICLPNHPAPTSHKLSADYYPEAADIAIKAGEMLGIDVSRKISDDATLPKDQPNKEFRGPF